MKMLRWGIIGFGGFADSCMSPAIMSLSGHELVAVMNRNIGKAKKYARKYNAPYYYDSAQELVNNPYIDTVYIATPNYQHCEHTLIAAKRGLHILCEKPMAMNLKEAEQMIEVSRQNNVKLMIGHTRRFHAGYQWARNCVTKGFLGEITAVRAVNEVYCPAEPTQWRFVPELSGGGAIMDIGIHSFDLLRYLSGREITQVSALTNTRSYPFPIDFISAVLIKFDNGVPGTVNVSRNNHQYGVGSFEINGTEGKLVGQRSGGSMLTVKVSLHRPRGPKVHKLTSNPFAAEIQHFAQCIENDQEPMTNGEEGMKNLEICLAAYESSRNNCTVDIS